MQRKISPLSDHVINQIAAGEVIERPLSIVKELVENSLDAGASAVEVRIESGGANLITVRDNGHGIASRELPLAVQRHCTSKLSNAEQLQQLDSLGFRGEALASIGAVSKLTINSRTETCSTGSEIICSYGELSDGHPTASYPVGTMVRVEDLFANTPARRKFLRQARTENLQISQLLKHIAFSHAEVSFGFFVDNKKIFNVAEYKGPDTQTKQRRLRELFGKEFAERAIEVELSEQGLGVSGWIGPIDLHRPRGDIQFLSVNGRVVKDRTLVHAVRLAYDGKIPEGRYACYALDISIASDVVDVNVHPTKTEVRFAAPRQIHDQIYSVVANTLSAHLSLLATSTSASGPMTYPSNADQEPSALRISEPIPERLSKARLQSREYARPPSRPRSRVTGRLFDDKQPTDNIFAGLYFGRYLLVTLNSVQTLDDEIADNPTFVDLVALLTSLFKTRLAEDRRSRPLIVPETLGEELSTFYVPLVEQLKQNGVIIVESESAGLLLKGIPIVLLPINHEEFLSKLAAQENLVGKDLATAVSTAAAQSVLVPEDSAALTRWLAQILEQLTAVKLNWQDYRVIRSKNQWQTFLGD